MSKTTKGPRRSRIATVLSFFREGHPDEIRAVFHILAEERLIPDSPKREQVRRKRRVNGAVQIEEVAREAGDQN